MVDIAERKLDARPDSLDFRDRMYEPTLVEVPMHRDLDEYRDQGVPILDQGREGACTGFGLATVANYLLRHRRVEPDDTPVSPRMLYEMARRYDEWPGEDYSGSSARGAMKGWFNHGLCAEKLWPYSANGDVGTLNNNRAVDAISRPLGAYFRVNHKDLIAMHSAISEAGVLFATATVHEGWQQPGRTGVIEVGRTIGGHAFAVVAYDERGLWVQNSWGTDWGLGGFALLTYDDWLEHGTDVWVARLGAPVRLESTSSTATLASKVAGASKSFSFHQLRPHVISLGNEGLPRQSGPFATSDRDVHELFGHDFPDITKAWPERRLLLYAHGGLVPEESAIGHVADYRAALLQHAVYPLAFVWHSDFWSTVKAIAEDALARRRPEGFLDDAKDFMLDRLDDALEPLARRMGGKSSWDEMKENAGLATAGEGGGARLAAGHIARLAGEGVEIHLVGHSAGSIFLAPLIQLLTAKGPIGSGPLQGVEGLGVTIASCTLWAPACTVRLFKEAYVPAIRSGSLQRFSLFTLTDTVEQDDDCAGIYHKSLLYLVSNAFEETSRVPLPGRDGKRLDGTPLLGMKKWVEADAGLVELFRRPGIEWVQSPNGAPMGSRSASRAHHHGDFDDDRATLLATLARLVGKEEVSAELTVRRRASGTRLRRQELMASTQAVLA